MLPLSWEIALPALVRPAEPKDSRRIGELWAQGIRQLGAGCGLHAPRGRTVDVGEQAARLRQRIERNDPVFVAVMNGRIVGVAAAQPYPERQPRYAAELIAFCVEPAFQGEGIGRTLLDAVQFALAERGMTGLVAWLPAKTVSRIILLRLGADEIDRRQFGPPSQQQLAVAYAWPD